MAEQIYINSLLAAVSILIVTMIYRVTKLYLAYEKEAEESALNKSSQSLNDSGDENIHTPLSDEAYQLKAA